MQNEKSKKQKAIRVGSLIFIFVLNFATDDKILLSEILIQQHAYFELDNKLKVLAISDPTTKESAASISLVFGQADGPFEYPGLAHAHEHACFWAAETFQKVMIGTVFLNLIRPMRQHSLISLVTILKLNPNILMQL